MTGPDLDAVVVGDGPAGLALAAACRAAGADVAVVGRGEPWGATYGTWRDDVADLPDDVFEAISRRVVVVGERRHELDRAYGVLDGARLRARLAAGVDVRVAVATTVQHFTWGSRVVTSSGPVDARLVVDATGAGAFVRRGRLRRPAAWQTALGVVVPAGELPTTVEHGAVTLMDWRPLPGAPALHGGTPTFGYVVPVADGVLVEETVLAADPAVDPDALGLRLAARLGCDVDPAWRVERVRIPMGVPLPSRLDPVVAFGAAAGYVHPATGYSVAASLRAAPRVARAIAERRSTPAVHDAVWPTPHRRARVLHDYGLGVLARLDAAGTRAFFDAFFDLPAATWGAYLRVDAAPREVTAVMRAVFSAAPWRVRRRLMAANPLVLRRLLRP